MSIPQFIALFFALAPGIHAASLRENITSEAFLVTRAELRRHFAAPDDDAWRPASYADLEASRGTAQPDYLVVRFRAKVPGHYYGEAEARIDRRKHGQKIAVVLHFNPGWVEYFIPLDGGVYAMPATPGSPIVTVIWNELRAK
ncbi:MAG TPA: hypothetical protein VHN79_01070 [Lacunisphaera sp.]|nr:hypothetical protein [Lacunisphaera sp.]